MTKKFNVTLFRLPWTTSHFEDREKWFIGRESGMSYYTDLGGEKAAEEAFHLTNAPSDLLTEEQKQILKEENFKGPSLSVGDVVRVESVIRLNTNSFPEYYLCKSFGWEKYNEDPISLLRHLL
jgi:hypothetical protein